MLVHFFLVLLVDALRSALRLVQILLCQQRPPHPLGSRLCPKLLVRFGINRLLGAAQKRLLFQLDDGLLTASLFVYRFPVRQAVPPNFQLRNRIPIRRAYFNTVSIHFDGVTRTQLNGLFVQLLRQPGHFHGGISGGQGHRKTLRQNRSVQIQTHVVQRCFGGAIRLRCGGLGGGSYRKSYERNGRPYEGALVSTGFKKVFHESIISLKLG